MKELYNPRLRRRVSSVYRRAASVLDLSRGKFNAV